MDGQGRDQSVSCTWMNQPTMHSINVTNLIGNDPTIPRRQKLGRFRYITRATRTLPCNMIKRAKFSATIPNAHGRRTMRHPTTKSSRRESGTTSQGHCFRTGSDKLTSSMPVNPTKISGSIMKAVKLSIRSLKRHVTTQAPSTPSVTNNMLTLTNVTGGRKIQTAARIRMSPLPFSRRVPAMRSQPRIKGMSRRAATSRPSHLMFKYVETSRGSFAVVRHVSATVM